MSGQSRYSVAFVVIFPFLALAPDTRAEKKPFATTPPPTGEWTALGAGITGTWVKDLEVFGNQLIAGGIFTQAGGVPASNIAAWDGTAWSTLGSGLDGEVKAMTVHNAQLVVAGYFSMAGGVPAQHVAGWDGTSWSQVGSGRPASPEVLASYDGTLYAGINTTIGSMQDPIAVLDTWDGTSWQGFWMFPPYNPSTVAITGLDVVDGRLFIGGLFANQAGYVYDGTAMTSTGFAGFWVFTFAQYGGLVHEGGAIDRVLATWNGATTWTNLPGTSGWEFGSQAKDLEAYGGVLVVGGSFDPPIFPPNRGLITWDGTSFSTLGTGMNHGVNALCQYNGRLIAAGTFTTADDRPASMIAQWTEAPLPVLFSEFRATPRDAGVDVSWRLQHDEDLTSYSLYRTEGAAARPVHVASGNLVDGDGSYFDAGVAPATAYRYELVLRSRFGGEFRSPMADVTTPAVTTALGQNHPNPFNPSTTIEYSVAERTPVVIAIYHASGALVARLDEGVRAPGAYRAEWNGRDASGRSVASGVYFYRLDGTPEAAAKKMVLMK